MGTRQKNKWCILIVCMAIIGVLLAFFSGYCPVNQEVIVNNTNRCIGTTNLQPLDSRSEKCDEPHVQKLIHDCGTSITMEQAKSNTVAWSNRDILWQQRWPERQQDDRKASEVVPTVHFLWCGKQKFMFRHYLSILSALRVLHPSKLIFHYSELPLSNDYNTWFQELKASVFDLELQQFPGSQCDGKEKLKIVLSILASHGGFFIGSDMILARPASFKSSSNNIWLALAQGQTGDDPNKVIIAAKGGFDVDAVLKNVQDQAKAATRCGTPEQFSETSDCVAMEKDLFPMDIMTAGTPFAELARWLFYGKRELQVAKQDPTNPIPRISHFIKLKPTGRVDHGFSSGELDFSHYLSILSALYVAGFQRVYLHGEVPPTGKWWDDLAGKENVTFLFVDPPSSVFQQPVKVIQHIGDLVKYLVLDKYGGAYQDFDVVWASHVPDSLLQYPAVLGVEWEKKTEFPECINVGVLMAQARSTWLRNFMKTHTEFRDKEWGYNPILMPYRTYELYPDTAYLDHHLQVICYQKVCHPTWEPGYGRSINDNRKTLRIQDWRAEARSFHVTGPKPHQNFRSPEALKDAINKLPGKKSLFAEIGKEILQKSGRMHLIGAKKL